MASMCDVGGGVVGAHQEVETNAKIQKQEIARQHVQGKERKKGPG